MRSKDPVVRISNEADLTLTKLKHEVFIKTGQRIPKNGILNWAITNCPEMEKHFWEWVKSRKHEK